MSKGAFNFPVTQTSNFEMVRNQQNMSEPDYIYYNAQIINNSTQTENKVQDPTIDYIDTRIRAVVPHVSKYAVSVENFNIDGAGKNLPLFIPQIRKYEGNSTTVLNRNPNNTIYDITFTWQYGGSKESPLQVFQSTRTVQWISENQASWAGRPLPYPDYQYPQPEIPYYYCYTYSHWLKLVNSALACAWEDVKLAVAAALPTTPFGTECPFYTYDKVTNLFSLWQDSNTCVTPYGYPVSSGPFSPANAPNPLDVFGPSTAEGYAKGEFAFVGYNTNFEGLFTNFSTTYYSSKTLYAPVGYSFSHPIGSEGCETNVDPQVESGVVSSFTDDSMVISWNGTPNPVPSANWKFELPLNSTSTVTPVIGTQSTFTLTGNPIAQYLYSPISITGRSNSGTFILGSVDSYTQSTGALVINVTTVAPTGGSGTSWAFKLTPLNSSTTADPNKGEPVTLLVDQAPTVNLIYEGTAVDVIGATGSNNFSGTVEKYELSFSYNGVANPDTEPDGFKYTTTSPGPTGHFNPIISFTAQDGTFQAGDSIVGSSSAASGKVVQVLAGNSNRTNTININNLTAPFNIGDVVGVEDQIVGVGTIVSIAGPNEGNASNVPSVTLTVSGQKNPFQINDTVYVGDPGNPIATGKIINVIGANTGYATVGFANQQNSFGPREQLVNISQLGSGEIISIQGENTGYGTITYINAKADGAGSKFIVGEYLIANGYSFAQVVIDNTDAVDANGQGNQGNITARILNPLNWDGTGTQVGPPPSPGSAFAGSISGTIADYGGVAYLGHGTLTLGKINGTAWSVDNQLISTIGNDTAFATVTNFSYTEGSQLIVEVLTGNFKLNDVIYGASQSEPALFVIQNIDLPSKWNNGDILSWGGGAGTCQISMIQEVLGNTIYAIVGQVIGNYPQYNQEIFNKSAYKVVTLTLTNLIGGFINGDTVTNATGGASATVAWVGNATDPTSPIQNSMVLKDLSNQSGFNTGHITGRYAGLFLTVDNNGWRWNYAGTFLPANRAIPRQYNDLYFGTTQGRDGGIVCRSQGNNMYLYPYTSTPTAGTAIRTRISNSPSEPKYNPNFQALLFMEIVGAPLNIGDKLTCNNGAVGYVDRVDVFDQLTAIFLYDCNFMFVKDVPISVNNESGRVRWTSRGRSQEAWLQANLSITATSYPPEADITLNSLTLSSGFSAGITDSLPNAQIQTVLPYEPPNSPDTILTVQNIVGSFPSDATIVDRTTNAKAQIMSSVFQPGAMIVEPISGQFTVLDRITDVKSGGSANYVDKFLQEIVVNPTALPTGPSGIITDDTGSYLTLEGVVGTFASGQVFTVVGPAGNPYNGATGTVSQIPNFEIGKKLWGFGGQPSPSYLANAIVVNDTGSDGNPGIITLQNVQSVSEYAWRANDYIRQFWDEDGETGGSYTQATISSLPYDYNLTIIPNNNATAGSSWSIVPSTLTSSSLATPTTGGRSTLTTNLSENEVVFYPGDTLKVTEYIPILPTSPVYLPENVVQVDLSAGNSVVQTLQSIFPSSPETGATYVVLAQDYESTSSLWSPVASIVVATTFIPVREEYTGQPIILGTGNNGTQGNGTDGAFQKDLIETPLQDILPQTGYRGILQYQKKVPILSSLSLSNDDLKNLDIHFYWRNRLTNALIPLTLYNGGSTNVRLMFKKIRD